MPSKSSRSSKKRRAKTSKAQPQQSTPKNDDAKAKRAKHGAKGKHRGRKQQQPEDGEARQRALVQDTLEELAKYQEDSALPT